MLVLMHKKTNLPSKFEFECYTIGGKWQTVAGGKASPILGSLENTNGVLEERGGILGKNKGERVSILK